MELLFLALLVLTMAGALAMGFPVAFALPGSAILTIGMASLTGLLFAGDASAYFFQGGPIQWLNAGVTNFRGVYWEVERDTLIAIPLFVFMGIMLQRSKIAEDLLITMAQLFGPIPGGLGISVVFVGALLAATTGIVGATVVAMGLISLPVMLRNNYSHSLATGTISASGTLGQIIPPSIVLIILADQLSNATDQASTARKAEFKEATGSFAMPTEFDIISTSAGDMFLGAFLPGLVLVGLYILYILVLALLRPKMAPAVPYDGKYDRQFLLRVFLVLVPPLTLILVVLGSIIMGIATVNQAGAIGAIGATIMAGYRLMEGRRNAYWPAILAVVSVVAILVLLGQFDLNVKAIDSNADRIGIFLALLAVIGLCTAVAWSLWRTYKLEDTLKGVMVETAKTSSLVFIILLGAAMLTAAFRGFGGEELVKDFLTGLPGGFWAQFIVVMAVIFILGFFLDFIEIAVVVVPIVAPILLADPSANITAVWLGVMIGVNMQTSFLTPPFGFALFYLRGVAPPQVKTTEIYRGVVAFITLQLAGLAIVGVFPPLVNYLPNQAFLTAETAPPPQNPRLQLCLEERLFLRYDARDAALRDAITRARGLEIGYLPERPRKALAESIELAAATFDNIAAVRAADAALDAYAPGYTPLHRAARRIQAEMREIDAEIADVEDEIGNLTRNDGDPESISDLKVEIEALENQKAEVALTIPADWEAAHKRYVALANEDKKARGDYRRGVDGAYEPVRETLAFIADADALAALEDRLRGLTGALAEGDAKAATEAIRDTEGAIGTIAGASAIRTQLSRTRRALRGRNPDFDKANSELARALEIFAQEVAWRQRAAAELAPGLSAYERAIHDTIGARLQDRLPRDLAKEVAGCLSSHRDISLHF